MKIKSILLISLSLLLLNCTSKNNSEDFIKNTAGRYLYNSDEVVEVYFEKNELFLKWRGANSIKPLKVDENTFYVKEMNEKVQFITNPSNNQNYMVLVPKDSEKAINYDFRKLKKNEKTPNEYLKNNEFEKALEGYINIKEKDSLNAIIKESNLNSVGYRAIRDKRYHEAINIFQINVALYPSSSNVYDSLAEAYMKSGDTINAMENYTKSLKLDSGNSRAKRFIKKHEKKE